MMNYRSIGCIALGFAIVGSAMFGNARSAGGATTSATVYSGAEGALGINNTSASGGALEGTVTSSGNTTFPYPFGVFGSYAVSASTFGIGIAGISTSGYAVGAEVTGSNPALIAESEGTGAGLQLVTTAASPTALTINSTNSTALQIGNQNGGYALETTATNGLGLQATGTNAALFDSIGGNGGSAALGLQNGTGVEALGYDTSSAKLPALLAQSNSIYSGVFAGYNRTGSEVFQIENGTEDDSDLGPVDGSDVTMDGDLYVTGGLYECLQNDGGCSSIGANDPKVPDVKTRDGSSVRTFGSQSRTSTVEDFGSGRLTRGAAYVRLDPAITDSLRGSSSYLVFITPGGDSHGLYFSNRSPLGFEVHEMGNGRSSLDFSYRIVEPRSVSATVRSRRVVATRAPSTQQNEPAPEPVRIAQAQIRAQRIPAPNAAFVALLHPRARMQTERTAATSSSTAQPVTGSEGAVAYNNTATAGAAVEGTVAGSGNTTMSIPFGIFGDYMTSNSTFGIGAAGVSVSGYGVGAEALGSDAAIFGLNTGDDTPAMQVVTTSVGQGVQVQSAGAGIVANAGEAGYGIFASAAGGGYSVYATSTSGTAATFTSNVTKGGGQGSGGQAVLGTSTGTGISALGYDNSSVHYPALLAESEEGGDIFDGYNAHGTSAVFQIRGQTANNSGMAPSNGTDVSAYGDFFVYGGIFQCTTGGTCTAVTNSTDAQERQSEPTVEDFGETTLRGGVAYVALDPKFARTLDPRKPYFVFLTPNGDGATLYFSDRTQNGFVVRESDGGRSNLSFSYRIVAKPLGSTGMRFPTVPTVTGPARKSRIAGLHTTALPVHHLNIHPHHLVALASLRAALGGRR